MIVCYVLTAAFCIYCKAKVAAKIATLMLFLCCVDVIISSFVISDSVFYFYFALINGLLFSFLMRQQPVTLTIFIMFTVIVALLSNVFVFVEFYQWTAHVYTISITSCAQIAALLTDGFNRRALSNISGHRAGDAFINDHG